MDLYSPFILKQSVKRLAWHFWGSKRGGAKGNDHGHEVQGAVGQTLAIQQWITSKRNDAAVWILKQDHWATPAASP